jgi:hypothetical protein
MTGETIQDLLKPLIGKSGTISMVVSQVGHIGFAVSEHKKLTGVQVCADGMIRLERETGWAVIDPSEVVAVVWNGDAESSPGPIPVTFGIVELKRQVFAYFCVSSRGNVGPPC